MATKKKVGNLADIIPLLSEDQLTVANGMIQDALFMQDQLAELRERIKEEGVSENYQYGSKQTASMTTYLQVQKQYGVIIKFLMEQIPKNPVQQKNDELLEFLRTR